MHRNFFVNFLLFFFTLFFAGCDSGPKITLLGPEAQVLAFGDSLTYGTGAPAEQSYPEVLTRLLGRTVVNAGVPGEVSAAGLKRLPEMLDRHQPSLVILCHGGNDFLRRIDQETTTRNLKAMIEMIQAQGSDVLLVGVPKLGFGLGVPKFYAAIAEEKNIPYEGEILLDLLGDNSMKSDAIHPNATGYRLMAEALHEVINATQGK
jgi:lysophospholipase L1-like esterase